MSESEEQHPEEERRKRRPIQRWKRFLSNLRDLTDGEQ
jgi:hypothetical protein